MTITDFRALLVPLADADKAEGMAAYMKNNFVFLGISKPQRHAATREVLKNARRWDAATLHSSAEELWAQPEREFVYLALEILTAGVNNLRPNDLGWLRDLTQRQSWWDSIDTMSPRVIGPLVKNHPEVGEDVESWGNHPDFWLRRVAIIHQLGFKAATDEARLFRLCLQNGGEKEFFIRKGIGWALRQHARVAPEAITRFLNENEAHFSPLSLREARKHLPKADS